MKLSLRAEILADSSTMIRVAFLIDRLRRAGTEAQLLALLRGLDRSRIEPHLILLDGSDAESQSLEPSHCPVSRLGVCSFKHPRAAIQAWRLAAYLRRHRIDILQTYFLDSVYFGVPVARLAGVRAVVRVRNNLGYWLTPKHKRLGRWYGRWVHRTVTNSNEGRDALVAAEGLPADRIVVLENGVDTDRFDCCPPPFQHADLIRIGAVANLRPVKRLDLLIEAIAALRTQFPQVRLALAGNGPERERLQQLAADRGILDATEFVGAVSDVPAFLSTIDIAVLCSDSEGMSNAILEYMAAGRAIVATRVGANERLLRNETDGLLIPSGSPEALAQAISRLLADPAMACDLGVSARRRAREEFSREASCRRFETFYEELTIKKVRKAA